MSYCRWSSQNFKSDLYCYQSKFGYEIHVGSMRIIGELPPVDMNLILGDNITEENKKLWLAQNKVRDAYFKTCKREKIGLPSDGESFTLDTLDEFKDKLLELREEGYNFPDYVLTEIEEEKSEIK